MFNGKVEHINNVPQFSETLTGDLIAIRTLDGVAVSSIGLIGDVSLPSEINVPNTVKYEANTTDYWNTYRIPSEKDRLYVYLDYIEGQEEPSSVAFKWGDGINYVRNLPFCNRNKDYEIHIEDNVRHITQEEREYWNNKERAIVVNDLLGFIK